MFCYFGLQTEVQKFLFPGFLFFSNRCLIWEVLRGLSNVPTYPVKSTYNRRKLRNIDLNCNLVNLGRWIDYGFDWSPPWLARTFDYSPTTRLNRPFNRRKLRNVDLFCYLVTLGRWIDYGFDWAPPWLATTFDYSPTTQLNRPSTGE